MTTAAAPAPANTAKALAAPEEQFWLRYSPHGEFPLSTVSSIALHVLGISLLLLCGYLLAGYFQPPPNRVRVEPVRLAGGGMPGGVGDGPGRDAGPAPVQAGEEQPDQVPTPQPEKRQPLKVSGLQPPAQFTEEARRAIARTAGPADNQAIRNLLARVHNSMDPEQKPAPGRGPGAGGGPGGDGKGDGGKASLTRREKRMLRWTMHFNTNNSRDYLAQLAGLGAILAVPVAETKETTDYKLIRDLHQSPAKLLDENVESLNRIFWYDYDHRSVSEVMKVLGLSLRPGHFVAFIPESLEEELSKLERAKAGDRREDDIERTHFEVRKSGDKFYPVLRDIEFRH